MSGQAPTPSASSPGWFISGGLLVGFSIVGLGPLSLGFSPFLHLLRPAAAVGGCILLIVGTARIHQGRRIGTVLAALALIFSLASAWATYTYNARAYYVLHRPQFLLLGYALDHPSSRQTEPSYYGSSLPFFAINLSVTGLASGDSQGVFLPQWVGIPDDAGGFWDTRESPAGADMYGMLCADPVPLGDNWWSCGMADG
jgi:hypothetical protein